MHQLETSKGNWNIKMQTIIIFVSVATLCTVLCQPLDLEIAGDKSNEVQHHLNKRFINPMFALGGGADSGVTKIRTKRQTADECEKLSLCKLHARSQGNFLAAFQLYFVNKENARLWDHHARSIADCVERYGDCYE